MASLYQSGSFRFWSVISSLAPPAVRKSSKEVVEIALRAHAAADAEDVRRHLPRVELHEVARTVPEETGAGQEIVHLERLPHLETERREIEVDPPRLHVVRIEVDDDDDRAVERRGAALAG